MEAVTPTDTNQATITITYYAGSGTESWERLSKKYIVKNWADEADLRRLLDEIAAELNHLSGYGIWAIKVEAGALLFTVEYKDRFKPYKIKNTAIAFWHTLRFDVGYYLRSGIQTMGVVRLEIPRVMVALNATTQMPPYQPGDTLFQIQASSAGNKKAMRKAGTIFRIGYDTNDPFFRSFLRKISKGGVLFPDTNRDWRHTREPDWTHHSISWWELPQTQTSLYRLNKLRKQEEKKTKSRGTGAPKAGEGRHCL